MSESVTLGRRPLENKKREHFCQEYIKDWNAKQAAIRSGYSAKTANKQGSRLLTYVDVSQRVEYLAAQVMKRHEIEQDDIIQELGAISFSNILDYIDIEDREVTWTRGKGQNVQSATVFMSGVKLKDLSHIPHKIRRGIFSAVQSIRETHYGVEFKLYDKISALDKLGQYFNMWQGSAELIEQKPKSAEEKRKELGYEAVARLQGKSGE